MTPEHKALVAARAEVDAEHAKVNGDDGYNYAAGQEYGLRLALIILDKHLAAIEALSAQGGAEAVGKLYGPFGWLNGCRGLSEDSWELESDPLENSEEYFAIPLYALVDPFKEIGPFVAAAPAPVPDAVEALRFYAEGRHYNSHRNLETGEIARTALAALASNMPVEEGDLYDKIEGLAVDLSAAEVIPAGIAELESSNG